MAQKTLKGTKIAVLVESEFIPEEISAYQTRFRDLGADVHFMSRLWGKDSVTFVSDVVDPGQKAETLTVTLDFQNVNMSDYAAVIMAANYTSVRLRYFESANGKPLSPLEARNAPAVKFFEQAMLDPNLVKGALCHALWLLTPVPELLRGRRVICHEVVMADIANAGAIYTSSDTGVITDVDLVTGRSKDEVNAFINAITSLILKKRRGEAMPSYEAQAQSMRSGEKKVLIVLSSFGFWGEELVAPMEEFDKAGIDYEFATPYGHKPDVVDVSMDPDYIDPRLNRKITSPEMAEKVRAVIDSGVLDAVKPISEIELDTFDALLLVGGSGPVMDMNNCRELHALINQCVDANKLVAAECYAVGALCYTRKTRDPYLHSVIWGRRVTGHPIPHDYITQYGYANVDTKYPLIGPAIPLEYALRDAVGPDGEFIGNIDKEISVVIDLPLITSRSVASSQECGKQIVNCLVS